MMKKRSIALLLFATCLSRGWVPAQQQQAKPEQPRGPHRWEELTHFLKQHCYQCHDSFLKEGGLDLTSLSFDPDDPENRQQWVTIFDRVQAGEMPPESIPRSETAKRDRFLTDLSEQLTADGATHREVVLRRLNRTEYRNTLRDLLGERISVTDRLPDDRAPRTFDTIGQTLTISAAQIERYHEIARDVVSRFLAQGDPVEQLRVRQPARELVKQNMIYKWHRLLAAGEDGVVFFSSGRPRTWFDHVKIPARGKYRIQITTRAFQSDESVMMKMPTHQGDRYFAIPPEGRTIELTDYLVPGDRIFPQPFGTIHNVVTETRRKNKPIESYKGPGLWLGGVEIDGPLGKRPSPQYRQLIGGVDLSEGSLAEAKGIVSRLMPRAFRREITDRDRAIVFGVMDQLAEDGRAFEDILRQGMVTVLCHPKFLYLHEPLDETGKQIDDYAFASRLSYFLWSSMPDATLLELAGSGRLREPDVLRQQVERMLIDPKSRAMTENFTDQWARLDQIDMTQPDDDIYPEFDTWLRTSMIQETRHFFDEMLEQNRSVLDFVDSDWLILNERLAEHYGIDGITGEKYRKVSIAPEHVRGGLMTQASVLKLTANGINTSPVPRGLWVLEAMLGVHLPPPPEAVAAVEPDVTGAKTIRQQLAMHRDATSCAACHKKIDPPGFALENFDAIGGWRTHYRPLSEQAKDKPPLPVDASGVTADGIEFEGINDFKERLLKQDQRIARAIAEQLLVYATGREMEFSDRAELRRVAAQSRDAGYGFLDLIHTVVRSEIFNGP